MREITGKEPGAQAASLLGLEAAGLPDSLRVRVMDCVDCHNRPTHIYKPAATALDDAMTAGKIPTDLPYFHREAMAVLTAEYDSKELALEEINRQMQAFYAEQHPEVIEEYSQPLETAIKGVQTIYHDNVFPSMGIGWGTYPNHIGHQESPGCFRCHDYEMETDDGELISQDCSTCHTLLALEEENPEILQDLFPEE